MSKKDKIYHKKVRGEEMVFSSLSLPASLTEDIKLLKQCYESIWFSGKKQQRVTYEKVFERLLSRSGLGHVDPDVYEEFLFVKKTRKELPDVVTRDSSKAVDDPVARAEKNGTTLMAEARKDQRRVKAELVHQQRQPVLTDSFDSDDWGDF